MSGSSSRIVTEIIVDARLAEQGAAAYQAALDRMGQATGKLEEQTRASARAYNTVLASLDPVFNATRRLGQETANVELAMKGLDRQVMTGALTRDQYIGQFAALQGRLNDVKAATAGLASGTVTFGDAMRTASGHAASYSQSLHDVAIRSAAAADGMQRMAQAQAAYNSRSGALSSNPLFGDELSKRNADIQAYGNELDRLRAKYNPLFAVSKQYEAALNDLTAAYKVGAINEHEFEAGQERITAAFAAANAVATTYTGHLNEIAIRAADAADKLQRMGTAQAAFNARSGIGGNPLYGAAYDARAAGIGSAFNDADRERASVDKLFAASKAYEGELAAINRQRDIGNISIPTHTRLLNELNASFAQSAGPLENHNKAVAAVAGSSRAAQFAVRDFGVQSIDVFTQLASGAPVLTTFIQQGSQIGQVMAVSGTSVSQMAAGIRSGLATALAAVFSPMGLFVTGVVAAGAAVATLGVMAESNSRRLLDMQTALRGTRDDFAAMGASAIEAGKAVAASSVFGRDDATQAAGTISRSPNFGGTTAQLQQLVRIAGDVGTVMGVTLPEQAKLFARALEEPGKVAQELADKNLFGFDQELARSIKLQEAATGTVGAFNKVVDQLALKTGGAAKEALTPLSKSLNELSNALTGVGQSGDGLVNKLGTPITNMAAGFVGAITSIIPAINAAVDAIPPWLRNSVLAGSIPGALPLAAAGAARSATGGLSSYLPSGVLSQAWDWINQTGPTGDLPGASALRSGPRRQPTGGFIPYGSVLTPEQLAAAIARDNTPEHNASIMARDAWKLGGSYAGPPQLYGPPTAPGYGARDNLAADRAIQEANTSEYAKATEAANKYRGMLDALRQSGRGTSQEIADLTIKLQGAEKAQYDAIGPSAALARNLDEQTAAARRIGDAYKGGYAAVQAATIGNQAYAATLAIVAKTGGDFEQVLNATTAAMTRLSKQTIDNATAARNLDTNQQLEFLKAETNSLGQAADIRARDLAVLKERQTLVKAGADLESEASRTALANAAALADAQTRLQQGQQALNELGSIATNAFSQVANAITQSMFQSGGAVVNFGTVARAVFAQVANSMLQLALINPILNATVGGANRTTLDQVFSALGSSSGGSSSGGVMSMLGTGSSVYSGGNSLLELLGYKNIGQQLGLTGEGGLFSGAGTFLQTPLWGSGNGLAGGFASDAAFSGGASAGGFSATATLGSVLGAAGGGFALGSLAGMGTQALTNKTGPGPEIGAAIGTAIGIVLAPYTGGLSLLASALLGGLVGGSAGGLIGPHPESPYTSTGVNLSGGRLNVGDTFSQGFDASPERKQALADVNTLNTYLDAVGLKLDTLGNLSQVGQNTPGGFIDPSKFGDIASAFQNFRFSANDNGLTDRVLAGKSFPDLASLQTAVATYLQLVNTTIPALTAENKVTGAMSEAITALNAAFDPAIIAAAQYGIAIDDLVAAHERAIKKTVEQLDKPLVDASANFAIREQAAAAQLSGSTEDMLAAQLAAFDMQAQQQRTALSDQIVAIYGDAVKTNAGYAARMGDLERALGQERLTIQKAANAQIVQEQQNAANLVIGAISTISNYLTTLTTSPSYGVTPMAAYSSASGTFNTTAAAARAGDIQGLQNITKVSDAFLQASTAMFGHGSSFVSDRDKVLSVISSISALPNDTLTASAMAQIAQTQTQTLDNAMADLRAKVATLTIAAASQAGDITTAIGGTTDAVGGTTNAVGGTTNAVGGTTSAVGSLQTILDAILASTNLGFQEFQVINDAINIGTERVVYNIQRAALDIITGHFTGGGQFQAGGFVPHAMAGGGWVGNGAWNRDSVLARFAGGGNIALAGGEFVVSAPAAARYADMLPSINAGRYGGGGANDNRDILAELRALRGEVARLRATVAQGAMEQVAELKAGNATASAGRVDKNLLAQKVA